jgi:hypothetical protein
MLVAKDYNHPKVSTPTSAYLTKNEHQEAPEISLRINEALLSKPTGPHVSRIWEIKTGDRTFYYTTPNYLFQNTGLKKYFRRLLDYQSAIGVIEPRDISAFKYKRLYRRLNDLLSAHDNKHSLAQRAAVVSVLKKITQNVNISIKDIVIQINADNELVILKKGESGSHYIVIGDDKNDISYLFISNTPGVYYSIHTNEKDSLDKIIDSFSEE